MVHEAQPALPDWLEAVSNWGRWGDEDQRGTLNLITDREVVNASRLVQRGLSVGLGRSITPHPRADTHLPAQRYMRRSGADAPTEGMGTASEWLGMVFHGFSVTHLDAPSHVFWDGAMYNGTSADEVTGTSGARVGSVTLASDGIFARGVLLDIPAHRGVRWLETGVAVSADELDACAATQGVEIQPGDVLMIRTGRPAREEDVGIHDPMTEGNPGLDKSCVEWLANRDCAVLGSDVVQDAMTPGHPPHPMPIHVAGLVAMGLWLIDNMDLEALAGACREQGRWDVAFAMAPLKIWRGTGSPVNPVALL